MHRYTSLLCYCCCFLLTSPANSYSLHQPRDRNARHAVNSEKPSGEENNQENMLELEWPAEDNLDGILADTQKTNENKLDTENSTSGHDLQSNTSVQATGGGMNPGRSPSQADSSSGGLASGDDDFDFSKIIQDKTVNISATAEGSVSTPNTIIPSLSGSQLWNETGAETVEVEKSSATSNKANSGAEFIKELEELDAYVLNKSVEFTAGCEMPSNLSFCKHVTYPVPKAVARFAAFQDGLAKTAVDSLSLLTQGETTSCEGQLREIFCKEKFPVCQEFTGTIEWGEHGQVCEKLVMECSDRARELLARMGVCSKMTRGSFSLQECVTPLLPEADTHCNVTSEQAVSPWLYHAVMEISSLLDMQFELNKELSDACKSDIRNYFCTANMACFKNLDQDEHARNMKHLCEQSIKSCEKDELSLAVRVLFLNCTTYR